MSLHLHWFLPTSGDGREVSRHRQRGRDGVGRAPPTLDYLGQVARAAETLGLRGGAHPDRHLVRGRLDHHRGAARGRPAR